MIECRRVETQNPPSLAFLPLPRTFNDDFDEHPLATGKWVPHYAGGAAWPEARYWGGDGSDFKRKTSANGEQQIYVDPRYAGRATTPLGLDPFKVQDGVLSIVASRTPPELKAVLFNNEYISGILTTQGTFAQKYGYFEIRAKMPVGHRRLAGVLDARRRRRLAAGDRRAGRPRATARRPRDDDALADSFDPEDPVLRLRLRGARRLDRVPQLRCAVAAGPPDLFHRPQAGLRHQGADRLRRSHVHDRQSRDGFEIFRRRRIRRRANRLRRSHSRSTGFPPIKSTLEQADGESDVS